MGKNFCSANFLFVSYVKWEIYDEKRKKLKKYFSMGKKTTKGSLVILSALVIYRADCSI